MKHFYATDRIHIMQASVKEFNTEDIMQKTSSKLKKRRKKLVIVPDGVEPKKNKNNDMTEDNEIRINITSKQDNKIISQPIKNIEKYELININKINKLPDDYPDEFKEFCRVNTLKLPNITSKNGKALSIMLKYKFYYWNRDVCNKFIKKFNIETDDSIQLFNKHDQMGIQTSSGIDRGKYYIVYPYCLSNKHKMRKNFKFDGTEEEKNIEINKIKSTINTDYVTVPNSKWQLGHKNPGSTDNTNNNLVLQPPIQSKYRDNFIFIDTLTKIPTPNKLEKMIKQKEIEFTREQLLDYKGLFDKLLTST